MSNIADRLSNYFEARNVKSVESKFTEQDKVIVDILNKTLSDPATSILFYGSTNRHIAVSSFDESLILLIDAHNLIIRTVDNSIVFDIKLTREVNSYIVKMIVDANDKRFLSLKSRINKIIDVNLTNINERLNKL